MEGGGAGRYNQGEPLVFHIKVEEIRKDVFHECESREEVLKKIVEIVEGFVVDMIGSSIDKDIEVLL